MKKSQHNKLEILYKDKWIVVINKPVGLLSVSYSGHKGHSAQSMLEEILRKQGLVNAKHKPFSVHRLDRDTSGVMMFALSMPIQKQIMDNWQTMVTERLYVALSKILTKIKKMIYKILAQLMMNLQKMLTMLDLFLKKIKMIKLAKSFLQ